jgi:hypothetical protein
MDDLFSALGHPVRLWIVLHLLKHGPARQVDLARALAKSGLVPGRVNEGATSQYLRPLISAGLVVRDRPRAPLRLQYESQMVRLLTTASALRVATTSDSHDKADQRHAELMRALTSAVEDRQTADPGELPSGGAGDAS